MREHCTVEETAEFFGIEQTIVVEMIQHEWVVPVAERTLDDEDIARIRLILDLRNQFGANDEAIPLILHLVDQLYFLRNQLGRLGKN